MALEDQNELQDVVVVFEAPLRSTEPVAPEYQGDRYEELVNSVAAMRENVMSRLVASGLDAEAVLPESTAFNVLPARASARAVEAIKASPDVADVLPAGSDLPVDLSSR